MRVREVKQTTECKTEILHKNLLKLWFKNYSFFVIQLEKLCNYYVF